MNPNRDQANNTPSNPISGVFPPNISTTPRLSGATIITGGNTNVQIFHTSFNIPRGANTNPNTSNPGQSTNNSNISTIINNIMRFAGNLGLDEDQPQPTATQTIQDLPRVTITDEV